MEDIFIYKQKLSNLTKHIKVSFDMFSNEEIIVIDDIINTAYKYCFNNNEIINSALYQKFHKLILKYTLTETQHNIDFGTLSIYASNIAIGIVMANFISKVNQNMHNYAQSPEQFSDIISKINNQTIQGKLLENIPSDETSENYVQEYTKNLTSDIINGSQYSRLLHRHPLNNDLYTLRASQTIGLRQTQISEEMAGTVIDAPTGKETIDNLERGETIPE